MTTLREAAQQALEALEDFGMKHYENTGEVLHKDVYEALRAALAESVQEPVAWTYEWKHRLHGGSLNVSRARWPESHLWIETPLYAAPPQRLPLTEEEIAGLTKSYPASSMWRLIVSTARAIERAHGIGDSDE